MVRVGLIGFGLAGQAFHAPVIRGVPGMELACILERRGTRARKNILRCGWRERLQELLADKDIQLCVIATPNDSHFELASACLLAGRHVVVDKPFAPTLAEAEGIGAAGGGARTIDHGLSRPAVGWGFSARFEKSVQSGCWGLWSSMSVDMTAFAWSRKQNAWRERADQPGAGVLFDLGPHVIDQALVLFGEPRAITASAFCRAGNFAGG